MIHDQIRQKTLVVAHTRAFHGHGGAWDEQKHPRGEHGHFAPAADHEVPEHILADKAAWHNSLSSMRDKVGDYHMSDLETMLAHAHADIRENEGMDRDSLRVVRHAHASVVAIHEEAARRGQYVGTDNNLHPRSELAAHLPAESDHTAFPHLVGRIPGIEEHLSYQSQRDWARSFFAKGEPKHLIGLYTLATEGLPRARANRSRDLVANAEGTAQGMADALAARGLNGRGEPL